MVLRPSLHWCGGLSGGLGTVLDGLERAEEEEEAADGVADEVRAGEDESLTGAAVGFKSVHDVQTKILTSILCWLFLVLCLRVVVTSDFNPYSVR